MDVSVATPVLDLDSASMANMMLASDQIAGEDRLKFVGLIRYFNQLDIDMRELSQLRSCFIGQDKSSLQRVPIESFKADVKDVFKHYRELDEIAAKISDCVQIDEFADAERFNKMIDFMKSYQPMKVVRDKNNSSGMNYVMHPDVKELRQEKAKKLTIAQP